MRMRNIFSKLTLVFLLLAFTCAHGEIYSWVDKEGKKHFGEKVPKEYLKQSTELEVKPVNTMDAAKITKQPERNNSQRSGNSFAKPQQDTDSDTQNLSSCEQQKRAYDQSVKCYASCRQTEGGFGGRNINNVANCHCTDVKKPNCN